MEATAVGRSATPSWRAISPAGCSAGSSIAETGCWHGGCSTRSSHGSGHSRSGCSTAPWRWPRNWFHPPTGGFAVDGATVAAVSEGMLASSSAGAGDGATGTAGVADIGADGRGFTTGDGAGATAVVTPPSTNGLSAVCFPSAGLSVAGISADGFAAARAAEAGGVSDVGDPAAGLPVERLSVSGRGLAAGSGCRAVAPGAAAGGFASAFAEASRWLTAGRGATGARQPTVADSPHASITIDDDTEKIRIPDKPPRLPGPLSW